MKLQRHKQAKDNPVVLDAMDCILEEHRNREAFNRNLSIEEFKTAVDRGEIEYYGMTAEEITEELIKRGFGEVIK